MSKSRVHALIVAMSVLLLILGSNAYLNLGPASMVAAPQQVSAFERRAAIALWLVLAALGVIGFVAVVLAFSRGWRAASGLFVGLLYAIVVSINAMLAWHPLRVALVLPLTLGLGAVIFAVTQHRGMLRESATLCAISVVTLLSMKLFIWAT